MLALGAQAHVVDEGVASSDGERALRERLASLHGVIGVSPYIELTALAVHCLLYTSTLIVFDIDDLTSYNETFGRAAGDACIRRVAGVIGAAFKRGADVVARWEGGRIIALVRNADMAAIAAFATSVAQKVVGQHIHHPRAARQKFLSVSVAAASLVPSAESSPDVLVQAAMNALARAKLDFVARVAVAGPEDIVETGPSA